MIIAKAAEYSNVYLICSRHRAATALRSLYM